jgi:hypothetical protein
MARMYYVYFGQYNKGEKHVTQLTPNVVWKNCVLCCLQRTKPKLAILRQNSQELIVGVSKRAENRNIQWKTLQESNFAMTWTSSTIKNYGWPCI